MDDATPEAKAAAAYMRGAADDARDRGEYDLTLLMAAEAGDAFSAQAILDAGGSDLEARRDFDGATALLVACENGHVDCVEALIKAGCDKEARDNDGFTGLMIAAENGKLAVVQALLDTGGSDLEAREIDGYTAFQSACFRGHVDCMEALSKAGCNKEATANNFFTGWVRPRGQA